MCDEGSRRRRMKENALLQVRQGVGSVVLVLVGLLLGGCPWFPKPVVLVTVEVPVKPKLMLDGNIKEFQIHNFEGPVECAQELHNGIYAKAVTSKDLVPTIIGLPDLDGPLEIKGMVDKCSMRMGYGVLNATMQFWHGGKQLHQEVVKEETNRPGASTEEVRATLVERVIKRVALIFLPDQKPELRECRPLGSADPGCTAAKENNWKLGIDFWSKHLAQNQNDARAWYNRGIAHEGLKKFPEAVADYKKAVELERDELYVRVLGRAEKAVQDIAVIDRARKARE